MAARMTGNWQTGISNNEYLFHVRNLDMPFYQHNRGEVPAYNKDAWLRMMQQIKETQGEMRRTHLEPEPSSTKK